MTSYTQETGVILPPNQLTAAPLNPPVLYSDVNTYSPGLYSRTINVTAVIRSIMNAIKQPPFQRLFDPSGFDPETFLFRLNDPIIETSVRDYLYYISKRDPRWDPDRENTILMSINKDDNSILMQLAFVLTSDPSTSYRFVGSIRVG